MDEPREQEAPPVGEEIHLPGPTFLPMLCAAGITLAVIGTTISIILVIVGVLLVLGTAIRWIRETRRDIAALPPDHTQ